MIKSIMRMKRIRRTGGVGEGGTQKNQGQRVSFACDPAVPHAAVEGNKWTQRETGLPIDAA